MPLLIVNAIGLTMIAFGVHQILKPEKWIDYIPGIVDVIPVQPATKIRTHGFGNMLLGIFYITGIKFSITSKLVTAWWAFVLPVCWRHDWREGIRDVPILAAVITITLKAHNK